MRCCFSATWYSQPAFLNPLAHFLFERLLGRLALFLIPVFELADRVSLPIQEGFGIAIDSQCQRYRPDH